MSDLEESRILHWFDELKRGARAFYEKMCLCDEEFKNIVKYDESEFEKIFSKYDDFREKLHSIVKGKYIDRHKIISGIIFAATDKESLLFKVDYNAIKRSSLSGFPYWVICPNEYYLYTMILNILTNCVLETKKSELHGLSDMNYIIRFPDNVVWWEKDESQPYAEQFCDLLSLLIQKDDIIIKSLLLTSHLIFFYELVYDCVVKELGKTYYN
jgi:hypothetical protein